MNVFRYSWAFAGMLVPAIAAGQQRLPDIQVTATRTSVPVSDVPAAVTIITGESLRGRGIVSMIDALREVPGASLVQTGSYGAVTSFFLRGGESDYTKVLVDGVPINLPGGSINFANLTTDEVDRIEIVRGPASVLYGADAMSGVVQIITRRGSGPLSGEVSARGGSYGAMDINGRVAGGSGPWSFTAGGSRLASDGIYDFNSEYRNTTGSGSIGWSGRVTSAVLTGRYGDATAHFPTDGNGNIVDRNQYSRDRGLTLGLAVEHRLAADLRATVTGTMHRLRSLADDPMDSAADTSGYGFASERNSVQSRSGIEGRLDWALRPDAVLAFNLGLERESEEQESWARSNFGDGQFREDGEFESDRSTRFAAAQLRLVPAAGFTVQGGLRHDDNSAFGGFTTGRVAAQWAPGSGLRLWAAFGTSFKAPTFSEVSAIGPWEIGNPDLDPEHGRSWEGGFEVVRHSVRFGITGYSQEFTDFIQYRAGAPGEPTYVNLGAARVRGAEFTLGTSLDRSTLLSAQFSLIDSEVTDTGVVSSPLFALGKSLQRRPGSTVALTATRQVGGGSISLTGNWVGERDDADYRSFPAERITLPSYLVVDAAVTVPVPVAVGGRGAELMLRGENLLDEEYLQAVGFPGRGRTLLAGGRLRF